MSAKEDEKNKIEPCCPDPACCSPAQSNVEQPEEAGCGCSPPASKKSGLSSKIKTSIFVIVMLAAVGVAATSLLNKNSVESVVNTDDRFHVESMISTDDKTPLTQQTLDIPSLDSLASLDKVAADKDFLFILVPGEKTEDTEKAASIIGQASEVIFKKGISVAAFTLKTDSPDYEKLVSTFEINSFPAVLAMGKGCGSDIVKGMLSKDKLLASYVRASTPGLCGPASRGSASCCPQ